MPDFPQLLQTVIDAEDIRSLAEFYRQLLGLRYRPGDEPPNNPGAEDCGWLVLRDNDGINRLAFQRVERLRQTTWPIDDVPMQMHLDLRVETLRELERQRSRAVALGARLLADRSEDVEEPVYVFSDPAGHPFCIFVAS